MAETHRTANMSARLRRAKPGDLTHNASPPPSAPLRGRGGPDTAVPYAHDAVTSSSNLSSLTAPPWTPFSPRHARNSPPFSQCPPSSDTIVPITPSQSSLQWGSSVGPSATMVGGSTDFSQVYTSTSTPRVSDRDHVPHTNQANWAHGLTTSVSSGSHTVDKVTKPTCRTCGRAFNGKHARRNLHRHEDQHMLKRVFLCPRSDCGKSFKRDDAVLKHLRAVHGQEPDHQRKNQFLRPPTTRHSRSRSRSRSTQSTDERRSTMSRECLSDNATQLQPPYQTTAPSSYHFTSSGSSSSTGIADGATFGASVRQCTPLSGPIYPSIEGSMTDVPQSHRQFLRQRNPEEYQSQCIFPSSYAPGLPEHVDQPITDNQNHPAYSRGNHYQPSVPCGESCGVQSSAGSWNPSWQQLEMTQQQQLDNALEDDEVPDRITPTTPLITVQMAALSLPTTNDQPFHGHFTPDLPSSPLTPIHQDGSAPEIDDDATYHPPFDEGNDDVLSHFPIYHDDYDDGFSFEYPFSYDDES